jgi:maltose-binding protein MalE
MPEITLDEVRVGQGQRLADNTDVQLQFYIAEAKEIVLQDGVSIEHPLFKFLQLYRVYDLMESTGTIPNEVNQESVGDVSIGYDTNIAIGSAIFWKERYNQTLIKARGTFFSC